MLAERTWQTFVAELERDPIHRSHTIIVSESWRRSAAANIPRSSEGPLLRRIDQTELDRRLRRSEHLLRTAVPILQDFSDSQRMRHVVYLTDRDGIVLHSIGDPVWRAVQGLMPGFDWSEQTMGTNGAGTALVAGQAVAVVGPEHYRTEFAGATCIAAPLRDPKDNLVGAIDLSTSVEHAQVEQVAAIIGTAVLIQTALKEQRAGAATAGKWRRPEQRAG